MRITIKLTIRNICLKNLENESFSKRLEKIGALLEKLLGRYNAANATPTRLNIPQRLAFLKNNPKIKIAKEKISNINSGYIYLILSTVLKTGHLPTFLPAH